MNLDHPDLKDDRDVLERHLAELGPETVRAMLAGGAFPTTSHVVILEWLKADQKKDRA